MNNILISGHPCSDVKGYWRIANVRRGQLPSSVLILIALPDANYHNGLHYLSIYALLSRYIRMVTLHLGLTSRPIPLAHCLSSDDVLVVGQICRHAVSE